MNIRSDIVFVGSLFGVLAGVFGMIWELCSYIVIFYGIPIHMAEFVVYLVLVSIVLEGVGLMIFSITQIYIGYIDNRKSLIASGVFGILLGTFMLEISIIALSFIGIKTLFEFVGLLLALFAFLAFSYILQFIYGIITITFFAKIDDDLGLAGSILTFFYMPIGFILQALAILKRYGI